MYIALYFLIFLLYFTLRGKGDQEQAKRIFIYIITLALCLGSALRHMGVGNDTYAYFLDYEEVATISWEQILQSVKDYYSDSHLNPIEKDPGYVIFSKLFSSISHKFGVYQFSVALLFLSAVGRMIYKGVKPFWGYLLSYTFFIFVFYHYLPNSATRQTIAMGIMLWGIILWMEEQSRKRLLLATLMILAASTIHKSSLVGFLPLIAAWINRPKLIFLSAIIGCPLLFLFGQSAAQFLGELSQVEDYMAYGISSFYNTAEKPTSFIYLMILFYGIGLIRIKGIERESDFIRLSYALFSIAISIISFVQVDPSLQRLIAYFSLWGVIYLPNAIDRLGERNIKAVLCAMILIVIVGRSVLSPPVYKFYWEQMQLHERYG